jgi:hypothetical protein
MLQPDITLLAGTYLANSWHGDKNWLCAAWVPAGMITPAAGIPRKSSLFFQHVAKWLNCIHL